MRITEQFILLQAPNPAAAENGRALSKKGKFSSLGQNAGGDTFWAECAGSGSKPYRVSLDFSRGEDQPVCRCSCPSRQFPCKHALGLMFEIAAGKEFIVGDLPADLAEKQAKQAAKDAKAAARKDAGEAGPDTDEAAAKPKKTNTAAQKKKLQKQLEGLDVADRMIEDLLSKGLSSLEGTSASSFDKLAKELGNYYLTGPQTSFERIALIVRRIQGDKEHSQLYYSECLRILIALRAVTKRSREYIQSKLDSGNYAAEDSALYEALGGVWKLDDLRAIGSLRENAKLVQLSFDVSFDETKKEYVERGYYIDASCGEISQTLNLRPAKALKYVKADDSRFDVLEIPVLYKYPGAGCTRVRWEGCSVRGLTDTDIAAIRNYASGSIAETLKAAKNQFKNTLMPKYMPALIAVSRAGKVNGTLAAEDASGARIELRDRREDGKELSCTGRIARLPEDMRPGDVLFGSVFYDQADGHICMHPYSVITADKVIRLNY